MADYYLVASLAKLRDEFNGLAPKRDKSSDGWIGDARHAASVSDHNPDGKGAVHAIDVDEDFLAPGINMEKVVQFLLSRCRLGLETRLKYIIYERRIWSASSGWVQRVYSGINAHEHHAHFSGKYDSASERSVASWRLADLMIKEDDVALSADDKKWLQAEINKVDENVRATARNNAEFLSDTEKLELRNSVVAELKPALDGLKTQLEEVQRLLRPVE